MTTRSCSRAIVALVAAYALALQAILLAFGALPAGAGEFAAVPICSSLGTGHPAPAGHAPDCLGACLTGCCGGVPLLPAPAMLTADASIPMPAVAAMAETAPPSYLRPARAHRSRAPPLAWIS
jgi:hypothetical protein